MARHHIATMTTLFCVGLLSASCAQWQKSWTNPHAYTQRFEHRFLALERVDYPALSPATPTEVAAQQGTSPSDTNRWAQADTQRPRPLVPAKAAPAPVIPVAKGPVKHVIAGRVLVPVAPLIEVADRPAHASGLDIEELPDNMIASIPQEAPTAKTPAPVVQGNKTTEEPPEANLPTNEPREDTIRATEPEQVSSLGDGTPSSELLAAAQRTLGIETDLDPTGFANHLIQVNDLPVTNRNNAPIVKALYEYLNTTDQLLEGAIEPRAGDLVFFHNTYDRDDDQRADDWFTLVGIVERVNGDGTVLFISYAQGKIKRLRMNLDRPSDPLNHYTKQILNSALRKKELTDRPYTSYLSGELFASFGRLQD
jgi:hypothetical protein